MAGNDDLHPLLSNISESIGKLREDIQTLIGEVKKIPELVERGFKQVRDAIHESIQAQAELKMMEQMMEVSTTKPQIEAEKEQIESVRDELEERLTNISERYEEKHAELDKKAEQRVRNLGSHIFAIEEDQFEDGIEKPFTTQVTPIWRNLQGHNETVNHERETEVIGTTESVVEEIDAFLNRKEQLIEQIDDHLLEPESVPIETTEQTEIQLPYYVVEYEIEGVSEQLVVPPSDVALSDDTEGWSSATLEPIHGADKMVNGEIDTTSAAEEPLSQEAISDDLDQYATEKRLGPSYTQAVETAIPETVEITIEGGAE